MKYKVILLLCISSVLASVVFEIKRGNDSSTVIATNAVSSVTTQSNVVSNGTVSLSDVVPPVFGDNFLTLESAGCTSYVDWGISDSWFCWRQSGYPGFGHQIVIQAFSTLDGFLDDTVTLTTDYGVYVYKKSQEYGAYCSDTNVLTELGTNKALSNFGTRGEKLYVFSNADKKATEYLLVEETTIS